MSERVFYALLERVGGNGRYQVITLCAWSILMMVIGSTKFFLPYLFYQSNYQCPVEYSDCKEYVCSLPLDERAHFIQDSRFSYRCSNNVELDLLQSFIYFGGVIGVLAGAFVNEYITIRMLLMVTVFASIIGLGTALLGQTLLIASIGLFLASAATAISMEMLQCYIVETVSQNVRGQHLNLTYIFFSVGVTSNGIFFYYLRHWQVYLIILILLLVMILLFLKFYITETPFDAIIYSTPQDALKALEDIEQVNRTQSHPKITLAELENIKKQFQENEKKNKHSSISIIDLFRFGSLRTITIVSLVLHYVTCFQFSAPEIAVKNYSLSIYTNGIVIGLAEVFGSIACYFLIDHYERKKVIYWTQAICIFTSVPIFLYFSCKEGTCSISFQIIQTIGLTIFKFFSTIAYCFFYIMQYEIFPNQIRGLAIQIVCMPSYLATVTLPQIITFFDNSGISIVFSFVICSAMVVALMLFLPETFGIPPPEIIQQLKYQHHTLEDPIAQDNMKET